MSSDNLSHFLANTGRFSVLVLGPRGIGKTQKIIEFAKEQGKKLVSANCASFATDTMAESELFGHTKGSFTGADSEKKGLFFEAEKGILLLDEVHTLSFAVQSKLMTALQTEGDEPNRGKFKIRKVGSNKTEYVAFTPVFASNLRIERLKEKLLPDFYDRISQLVIEFKSIKEIGQSVYQEFRMVWINMKFEKFENPPTIDKLKDWLNMIPLEGNYRDLQIIAINWHQYRLIENAKSPTNLVEAENNIFMQVKSDFEKYHCNISSYVTENAKYNFRKGVPKKVMKLEYERALIEWSKSEDGYGAREKDIQNGLKITGRIKNRINDIDKQLN